MFVRVAFLCSCYFTDFTVKQHVATLHVKGAYVSLGLFRVETDQKGTINTS